MQSSNNASEPNHSQPQPEPTDPTPQEGQSSQSQQADEPILQQEPQQSDPENDQQSFPIQAEDRPATDQDQHRSDEVSEANHPQPQAEPMHQAYEPILQQNPPHFHPLNYPQPLSSVVYEPPANDPLSQNQQKFDQVSEPNYSQPQAEPMNQKPQEAQSFKSQPGFQQPHLLDYPQPISTVVYQPPASDPSSRDQYKFEEVPEPNLPQPQAFPLDQKSQEAQGFQSQQASEPILQPGFKQFHLLDYPQPLSTLVYQPPANDPPSEEHKFEELPEPNLPQPQVFPLDPKPQEVQSFQSQQASEPILQPGFKQLHPLDYPQPLSTLVYQPPVNDPPSQNQHKFDQVSESNPPQPQALPMDPKLEEGQNFQSQSAPDLIFQQGSQESHPQNYQPPLLNQAYQPPAVNPYSQEQVDYAVYHLEVQQGQDAAMKDFMTEHISKGIKAPGKGFVVLYFLIVILGSLALAFRFPDDNGYQTLLSTYRRNSSYDYQIGNTFMNPGSCQAFFGVTLGVPFFLVIFITMNFLDSFAFCLGITWGMYLQFFMAGIWTSLAAYTTQQRCNDQNILNPENPWFYLAGMAVASLGAGLLNYLFSNSKEKAENNKKELTLLLSAC